eukprot:2641560-Prymnesium_polylepis.1
MGVGGERRWGLSMAVARSRREAARGGARWREAACAMGLRLLRGTRQRTRSSACALPAPPHSCHEPHTDTVRCSGSAHSQHRPAGARDLNDHIE